MRIIPANKFNQLTFKDLKLVVYSATNSMFHDNNVFFTEKGIVWVVFFGDNHVRPQSLLYYEKNKQKKNTFRIFKMPFFFANWN